MSQAMLEPISEGILGVQPKIFDICFMPFDEVQSNADLI